MLSSALDALFGRAYRIDPNVCTFSLRDVKIAIVAELAEAAIKIPRLRIKNVFQKNIYIHIYVWRNGFVFQRHNCRTDPV